MQPMTDLERCIHEGISLTELRKRREEVSRRMVEPAMVAFRRVLAERLAAPADDPVE